MRKSWVLLVLVLFAGLAQPRTACAENRVNWSLGGVGQLSVAHADDAQLVGGGVGFVANSPGWFWAKAAVNFHENRVRHLLAEGGTRVYFGLPSHNYFANFAGGVATTLDGYAKDAYGPTASVSLGRVFHFAPRYDCSCRSIDVGLEVRILPDTRNDEKLGDFAAALFVAWRSVWPIDE